MARFPSVTEMMDALNYTPEARRLRTTSQVLAEYTAAFPQEVPVKKSAQPKTPRAPKPAQPAGDKEQAALQAKLDKNRAVIVSPDSTAEAVAAAAGHYIWAAGRLFGQDSAEYAAARTEVAAARARAGKPAGAGIAPEKEKIVAVKRGATSLTDKLAAARARVFDARLSAEDRIAALSGWLAAAKKVEDDAHEIARLKDFIAGIRADFKEFGLPPVVRLLSADEQASVRAILGDHASDADAAPAQPLAAEPAKPAPKPARKKRTPKTAVEDASTATADAPEPVAV